MPDTFLYLFGAGLLGALIKDITQDNVLTLPKITEGKIILGSLGGAIVGGFVGYLVDHSVITAFMSGYAGTAMLTSLITQDQSRRKDDVSTK